MKILIVYTSRESGNTKKLAEALASHFGAECGLYDVADAPAPDHYDFIALGFGVYHNFPDCIMVDYMRKCRNKDVGIFMTLGMWPDSVHAYNCFGRAEGLMPSCRIRVKFACQGAYMPEYLEKLKSRPPTSPHGWTPERAERILEAMKHPNENDLKALCEKFEAAIAKLREKPYSEKPAEKTAVLTAFFGSTVPSALKAYDTIENAVREKYPSIPVFRAYTSRMVRRKRGNDVPSAAARLQELFLAGYDTVHILAGYLTPGEEYHKLKQTAAIFSMRMNVTVSKPPLSNPESLRRFLPGVLKAVDPDCPGKVLFMGHGNSDGRSAFAYLAAAAKLKKLNPEIFLACVEGEPGLESVLGRFQSESVQLIPFMLVAGDHALNDLAGNDASSWKSQLEKRSCTCYCTLHGLGEISEVASYFADSLPEKI
ncbi:MAG: sirohydrochlorin cobaltochelatase [Lentisphaeria bacterium]|nr:sirohydrochlorin cobaltochelatase [Lentisphaeria bacterium]